MRHADRILLLATVALLAAPLRADDWPGFGGPGGRGISAEKGLARSWPAGGPKELWKIELGEGWGAAAVRDGEVYVLDRPDEKKDVLRCQDLNSGKELWTFSYSAPGSLSYDGSRTVPTVDDKAVFTLSAFGLLHCIDRKTHQAVWSHHLVREFREQQPATRGFTAQWGQTQLPKWGISQHPVLYKDWVIVAPQSMSVGVVAYEKTTGKLAWSSSYIGRNWFSHVTPIVARLCGVDQIVVVANAEFAGDPTAYVSGVDANTGKLLWQIETWKRYNVPIPSPVQIADDKVFVAGGYRIGCFALKVKRDGESWSVDYAFKDNDNCTPHIHTPLFFEGHVYANSFDKFHNTVNKGLVCLDTDGKLKWKSAPAKHFESGGMLIAGGMIYIMHGQTGVLTLLEATPEGYRELASAKVLDAEDGTVWAPLALSDGRLLVRDMRVMKCLDVRGQR
jgi:outer membrane protein assembly factor BamB